MLSIHTHLSLSDPACLADKLAEFISTTVRQQGKAGCVLGLSGGLDSAVVAALAMRALDRHDIHPVYLPERDSSKASRTDAHRVADHLGLTIQEINITAVIRKIGVYRLEPSMGFYPRSWREKAIRREHARTNSNGANSFTDMLRGGSNVSNLRHMVFSNTKNRVRMAVLYHQAELINCVVLGTCNRSERMAGLFVKHGDGASDVSVLHDLYKTQVYELSRYLKLPQQIIDKVPSGDLMPGIHDEQTLGIGYAELDQILAGLELRLPDDEIIEQTGLAHASVNHVRTLVEVSQFNRHGIFIPDLSARP